MDAQWVDLFLLWTVTNNGTRMYIQCTSMQKWNLLSLSTVLYSQSGDIICSYKTTAKILWCLWVMRRSANRVYIYDICTKETVMLNVNLLPISLIQTVWQEDLGIFMQTDCIATLSIRTVYKMAKITIDNNSLLDKY